MPNPFFYGGKVENPSDFIGRKVELQRIFSALETAHSGQVQHISIVGERRIGKSSLMYHVIQTYPQRLSHPECYRFVYVDLDDPHCQTKTGLFAYILDALGLSLIADIGLELFQEQITQFHDSGICPVLCLDEFEHLTRRKEEFPDPVYEAWRSLGNHSKVAFITASHVPLSELSRQGNLTSPFHNIFTNIELTGFTEQDCQTLLARSADGGRLFTLDEQRRLLKLAGHSPGRLQYAAWQLYEAKGEHGLDWKKVEHDFAFQFPLASQKSNGETASENRRSKIASVLRWIFISAPQWTGHLILDIKGSTQAKDSTAWVVGGVVLVSILALIIFLLAAWLSGQINLAQVGQAILNFLQKYFFGNS